MPGAFRREGQILHRLPSPFGVCRRLLNNGRARAAIRAGGLFPMAHIRRDPPLADYGGNVLGAQAPFASARANAFTRALDHAGWRALRLGERRRVTSGPSA